MPPIDFIGDIHGHADKLNLLLKRLGYEHRKGAYRHPERTVLFVGDYIDRGPDNPRVIQIVRSMVDAGTAIALCGNHEFNAICFNLMGKNGYLRPHSIKNFKQHAATLLQFQGKQAAYDATIRWFMNLPLFYETADFRAVHATWEQASIQYLQQATSGGVLSEDQYAEATDRHSELYRAVDITCKGKEIPLPGGASFFDKDGTQRFSIRSKWWLDPRGKTVSEMSIIEMLALPAIPYESDTYAYYGEGEKPVFFGHYWLSGSPALYRDNICCLDYSVAKNGLLCAYRFNGESRLDVKHFVYV